MDRKYKDKIKGGVLLLTAAFFALTSTIHPFQSDASQDIAGYAAAALLFISALIIIEKITLAFKGSRAGEKE